VETLSLIIKRYNYPKALSNVIFNNQKNKIKYNIEGPYGTGLGIQPDSKGLHVIVCGGTGILPFLDLIDFMFKKIAYEIILTKNGKE